MTDTLAAQAGALRLHAGDWARRGVAERIAVLARWSAEIAARRPALVAGLARDTGRLALSEMEVGAVLSSIERHSGWARELLAQGQERSSADGAVAIQDAPVPYGLVGVVSPWNFPLQLALIDAVPALLAGCAVLVKPSELTPSFVPALRESIAAVPELAAVLSIVEGGPAAGAELVRQVDAVCFTGSVSPAGWSPRQPPAVRPAFLELGRKDPAIVTATANLDVASSAILWGSTANTGQSCMSLERVYVEAPVAEEFVERLVAKANRVRLAVPEPADRGARPVHRRPAGRCGRRSARRRGGAGATIRCGGRDRGPRWAALPASDGGDRRKSRNDADVGRDFRPCHSDHGGG